MRWFAKLKGHGLFGRQATQQYRALSVGQPMLLMRETTNPVDPNAIIAADIFGVPVAYVAKEIAAKVAPRMDAGEFFLCKIIQPAMEVPAMRRPGARAFTFVVCVIWRGDDEKVSTSNNSTEGTPVRESLVS